MLEDELEEIDEKLEMDYQIGEDFKEKVLCSLYFRRAVVTDDPSHF
jgi:hypothetical protein